MISKISKITSPDIADFDKYCPDDERGFSFWLTVFVGANDAPGEDMFDIQVCTPQWLMGQYGEGEMILGSYKLIVFKYDIERIFNKIRKLFDNCVGQDWNEIVKKLSRIGRWEFENYRS